MSESHLDAHWAVFREAVFTRDQHQCENCLGTVDDLTLDPDHTRTQWVPVAQIASRSPQVIALGESYVMLFDGSRNLVEELFKL